MDLLLSDLCHGIAASSPGAPNTSGGHGLIKIEWERRPIAVCPVPEPIPIRLVGLGVVETGPQGPPPTVSAPYAAVPGVLGRAGWLSPRWPQLWLTRPSQASSKRQPLKRLFTMIVIQCAAGDRQVPRR